METSGNTGERSPGSEQLDPQIARRIIGYFQIAQHLPPEDLESDHPLNPIRNLIKDRQVRQDEMDEFLDNLGRGKLEDLSKTFFESLAGPRSPVALSEAQRAENLNQINQDDDLSDILLQFKSDSRYIRTSEIHPNNIQSIRERFLIAAKWLGAEELQRATSNFDRFLELYFGSEAFAYSRNFAILDKMAGEKQARRWKARYAELKAKHDADFSARYSSSPRGPGSFIGQDPQEFERLYSHYWGSNRYDRSAVPTKNPDPQGLYATLGLPTSARNLPEKDFQRLLRDAWREAVKKAHPDAGGKNDEAVKINLARAFLKDPRRRAIYGN